MIWRYLCNIGMALDCLLNAVLGGNPAETVSMRGARAATENIRWGCILCKVLDFIDRDHCRKTYARNRNPIVAAVMFPFKATHWSDRKGLCCAVLFLIVVLGVLLWI